MRSILSITILGVGLCLAAPATADSPIITPADRVQPRGEIVERMKNAVACLDKAEPHELWTGFAAESVAGVNNMWGGDWPGRTLEAYSRVSLALGERATDRFDEVGDGLLKHLTEDGQFKTVFSGSPYDFSNGFWFGQCRGMLGLAWAYRYSGEEKYLDGLTRAADYIVAHFFDEGQPGQPGSFWWVATEALGETYRLTGDVRYIECARRIGHTIPPVNMEGQHTHSYLLSLRGCVYVHEAVGDLELLNKVLDQYRVFQERILWPGGGVIEHLGSRDGYSLNYWFDEGCSVDDWLGLNLDLWRVTRDARYMDMVERVHFNHLYYGQDASGGFCGDRGVDATREGAPWRFCCAMHGTRTLAELTQYIAVADGRSVWVNVFLPAEVSLDVAEQPVVLDLETDYPRSGRLSLKVVRGGGTFPLRVRVPAWSRVVALKVNGESVAPRFDGGYAFVDRAWKEGDTLEVSLAMPLRAEPRNRFIGDGPDTDYATMSLWEGPRQLVYNQALNNALWSLRPVRPGFREIQQTYGDLGRDRNARGTDLCIGDKSYEKGLGVHAVSEVAVALNGEFTHFVSDIGLDACTGGQGAVRFKACVDGMTTSGPAAPPAGEGSLVESLYGFSVAALDGRAPAQQVKLDLRDARVLRLIVDDGVNGLKEDVANWADAHLARADGTKVYLSDLPDDREEGMPWDWGQVRLERLEDDKDGVVTLKYEVDGATHPIRFNYLADLGYGLMAQRPVLRSYFKVDPNWVYASTEGEKP